MEIEAPVKRLLLAHFDEYLTIHPGVATDISEFRRFAHPIQPWAWLRSAFWTVSEWERQGIWEITPELHELLRSNDAWGTLLNQPYFIARRA